MQGRFPESSRPLMCPLKIRNGFLPEVWGKGICQIRPCGTLALAGGLRGTWVVSPVRSSQAFPGPVFAGAGPTASPASWAPKSPGTKGFSPPDKASCADLYLRSTHTLDGWPGSFPEWGWDRPHPAGPHSTQRPPDEAPALSSQSRPCRWSPDTTHDSSQNSVGGKMTLP